MAHRWQRGLAWFKSELKAKNSLNKKIVGEKTPELIYVDAALPRIKASCSDSVKFVLMLRCPVKRAFSNWSMMVSNRLS